MPKRNRNRDHYPAVITTSEFWDCECEDGKPYIHHRSEKRCIICNARKDEQPDSHIPEVISQVLFCTVSN